MALSLTTRPSTLATRRAPASRSAAAPLRVSAPAPGRANARKSPVVAAATTDDGVVAAAKKIGLDPEEGIFGFTPFAELWTGRLAMLGFVSSILGEATTAAHGGALAQIGLPAPSPGVTATLLTVFGGLTAASAFRTLYEATSGTMSTRDAARWGRLLSVREADLAAQAAAGASLKKGGGTDFTGPTSLAAIAAAKAAGSPADAVLGGGAGAGDASSAASAAAATADTASAAAKTGATAGPSVSLAARADALETAAGAGDASWAYARAVELDNGRAAMFGFFVSVFVESINGQGIIAQVFSIFKAAGLLGPASGF